MPIVYKYIQCFYNLKFSDIKFVFIFPLDRHMLIEDNNLIENIKFDEGKFPSKH